MFWRVDAEFSDGRIAAGPVWTFSTESSTGADASGRTIVLEPTENAYTWKRGTGTKVRGPYPSSQALIGGWKGNEMWLKFDTSGIVGDILSAQLRLSKFSASLPASEVPADYYGTDDDLYVWQVDPSDWTTGTLTKNLAKTITGTQLPTISAVGQLGTAVVDLGPNLPKEELSFRFDAPNSASTNAGTSKFSERYYSLDIAHNSPALVITRD